jgi:DMSO/TMAO reductase YedYZ molybdopterin-dependent catalytic subunit
MSEDAHKSEPPEAQFSQLKDDSAPDAAVEKIDPARPSAPPPAQKRKRLRELLQETDLLPVEMPVRKLKSISRRDFLICTVGAAASLATFYWLLPDETRVLIAGMFGSARLDTLAARVGLNSDRKTTLLANTLTFDDDVAEALYSKDRSVPTYSKSAVTPNLINNYDGQTPDPSYIATWRLELTGLASGKDVSLTAGYLRSNFKHYEDITRLVCVEGWSAIAWWGGLRFADLLAAYPPCPDSKWAKLESSVNLDSDGNSDPYYVSIDLPTAQHPQTLLATHHNGSLLEVGHGAPVRLVAPMKLGLKNIKAVTKISYSREEPTDYWNDRGYSKYDGL